MNLRNTVIYTGITSDLVKRIWQHKNKLVAGFTEKYNLEKLIYYEVFADVELAIKREKEIKGWTRKKKVKLIKEINPKLKDLYKDIL